MTTTHRKIRNVSGEDLVVPWLAGRVVEADEVVLVPEADVASYLCQPAVWEPHDLETEQAYAEVIAEAEKAAQQAAEAEAAARPEPFDPGPPVVGEEFVVPLEEQSQAYLERAAAAAAAGDGEQLEHHDEPAVEQPVEQAPVEDAGPLRTADAPSPATTRPQAEPPARTADPAPAPEPAVEPAQPTRSAWVEQAYADLDLANRPAEDTVTGMLAAVPKRPTL